MSWIFSTLTPSVLGQVTNSKSSFEVWSKIERTYAQRSMARIMQLKQQMQNIKKGSDSVSEFVLKIKTISDALMAAGEVVSDRDMIISLLHGVGHEYDSVVTLISSQQNTMLLEDAQFLFLMHEQRIEQLNSTANLSIVPSAQFASSGQNQYNNRGNNGYRGGFNNFRGGNRGRHRGGGRSFGRGNQRVYCQLCGKPGHVVLQCYRRFDQQYNGPLAQGTSAQGNQNQNFHSNQANQSNQAFFTQQQLQNSSFEQGGNHNAMFHNENVLTGASSSAYGAPGSAYGAPSSAYGAPSSAYFATPESVMDQAWYVDSGATNHVTANLNNLSVRSEYKGNDKLYVGNGNQLKISHVGDTRIKSHCTPCHD